jgi:hypothetical protein
MYKNAKATRSKTASAAMTPPAIAAEFELLAATLKLAVVAIEDEEANGPLKADVGDDDTSSSKL